MGCDFQGDSAAVSGAAVSDLSHVITDQRIKVVTVGADRLGFRLSGEADVPLRQAEGVGGLAHLSPALCISWR